MPYRLTGGIRSLRSAQNRWFQRPVIIGSRLSILPSSQLVEGGHGSNSWLSRRFCQEGKKDTSKEAMATKPKSVKLWGGRFSGENDPLMERFNASIHIDKRMWKEDLQGSMAYSAALTRCGLLTEEENASMQRGLQDVEKEWSTGRFEIISSDEDIHTANERRLTELIGPEIAGKLHTGRSRNDQCVTDFKLWLLHNIPVMVSKLDQIIETIINRFHSGETEAGEVVLTDEAEIVISGYTHLQQAQSVRWCHYLLAYAFMFKQDAEKLRDSLKYVDVCPLGSGAIAGHSFFQPTDRQQLARELGFSKVTDNSMDAVSNRDFVLDFLYHSSLISTHLSRLHEDLIIYNSAEFKIVEMSDMYSTGSSLMPQKKNPDACEIVRGKAGEMIGSLTAFFVTLKGLPSTYNKDLQDDKKITFAVFDSMVDCLDITDRVLATLSVHAYDFHGGLPGSKDNLFATDVADYLVRKKVPFRQTHHIAGEAVQLAEKKKTTLSKLTISDWKQLSPLFEEDILNIFDPVYSVEHKNAEGSTSKRSVKEQIGKLRKYLQ